jgi:hypothetical protein
MTLLTAVPLSGANTMVMSRYSVFRGSLIFLEMHMHITSLFHVAASDCTVNVILHPIATILAI